MHCVKEGIALTHEAITRGKGINYAVASRDQ